jgi:protein-S-isoprenylcysteine O-methyltransferase Ste14
MNRDESTAKILFNTLVFTILAPGGVTLGIPALLMASPLNIGALRFNPEPFRWLAGIFIMVGVLIYLWCTTDFVLRGRGSPNPDAAPTQLVVSGLYRFMRNPMYVGILAIIIGGGLWVGSTLLFIYAAVAFTIVHIRVIRYEEPVLLQQFGESYQKYLKRVPRWLPKVG